MYDEAKRRGAVRRAGATRGWSARRPARDALLAILEAIMRIERWELGEEEEGRCALCARDDGVQVEHLFLTPQLTYG